MKISISRLGYRDLFIYSLANQWHILALVETRPSSNFAVADIKGPVRTLRWTDRAAPSKPKLSFLLKEASDVHAARLGPRVRRERPSGRPESSWFEHPLRGTACTRRVVPRTVCAQGGEANFFAEQGRRSDRSCRMMAPGKVRDFCPPLCFHHPPILPLGLLGEPRCAPCAR